MKQIFPKEIIENSYEVHHAEHSKRSSVIYLIITLALLIAVALLPFIEVTIYNTSRGIIKSEKERMKLQTIQSGRVVYQNMHNNMQVQKGDTLLVIQNQALQDKEEYTQNELSDLVAFANDLRILLGKRRGRLSTPQYIQEQLFYQEKSREMKVRHDKAKADYERDFKLYKRSVIAKMELENRKLEYQVASSNMGQIEKEQRAKWQSQLVHYEKQIREMRATLSQLTENKDLSVLTAPESGTLLEVLGISKGSFVNSSMQLAVLSPRTDLLVECYLNPSDIGLLKDGNKVNFQVDAFNYNQWGLATGEVASIANDVQLNNGMPVFKVQCSLNQRGLTLKNGFEGRLKKGMTLTARFELTKRTLFELLYDEVDDWLNPGTLGDNRS